MSESFARPLAVTAMGAVSPVGGDLDQTCTSIRAGLCGLAEYPAYVTLSENPDLEPGSPLTAASCPIVAAETEGWPRIEALAIPALHEVARSGRLKREDLEATALLVALPVEDEAVKDWGAREDFLSELLRTIGVGALAAVRQDASGHTGVFELVAQANALLDGERIRACILLGVDSYLSSDRLALWDRHWRLRSNRNPDGLLPGEASCAFLLETPDNAAARSQPIRALIRSVGFGQEPNALASEKQSSGAGLCQAISGANPSALAAAWICCDLNGESYRSFEWGVTQVRLHDRLANSGAVHHPAECVGDVGAATGAVLVAHAAFAMGRGRPPAKEALLWTSADAGGRSALVLSAPQNL